MEEGTSQQERPSSDDVRARLDELNEENRMLRRSLTDAQTSLALQRSEVAGIKAQCEEKCYELAKYYALQLLFVAILKYYLFIYSGSQYS